MSATTLDPAAYLSTHAYEQDIPPSIADGVAGLLAQDQRIVVVTGRTDGRMSGFLADLSHGISKRCTLLRIKAPLAPEEFFAALAAQLGLSLDGRLPAAARVGQRLMQPAPKGQFVLLCEGADQYGDATLEAIRQISNYPVSIVLAGSHRLHRRLGARRLAPLKARVTHTLALNRRWLAKLFWPTVLLLVGLGGALVYWAAPSAPPSEDRVPPRPIAARPAPPAPPAPAAAATAGDVALRLERELASTPNPR